jgi:hypothetical protein
MHCQADHKHSSQDLVQQAVEQYQIGDKSHPIKLCQYDIDTWTITGS